MARKFFYVCGGIFLLALSYHLGARSARAQGGVIDVAWVGQAGAPEPYYAVVVQGVRLALRIRASFQGPWQQSLVGTDSWSGCCGCVRRHGAW